MEFDVEIKGLDGVMAALEAMPQKLRNDAMRIATKSALDVFAAEAIALAPWEHLRNGVAGARKVSLMADGVEGKVGSGRRIRDAHFAEFGVHPHTVQIKSKRVLSTGPDGQTFGTKAQHPGVGARPYMRPAFDTQNEAALERFAEVIRNYINAYNSVAK